MPLPDRVTTSELAGLLGISTRRVRQLAEAGTLPKVEAGRFVLAEAIQAYCAGLRSAAAGRGGDDQVDLARERALLAREQREGTALKNARLRGELLEAPAVEREWSDILSGVRARMLAIPGAASQAISHLTPHDLDEMDRLIRLALDEASRDGSAAG